jgi:hypothetical protein
VTVNHSSSGRAGSIPVSGTWRNARSVNSKVWVKILFVTAKEKLLKRVVSAESADMLNA